MSDAGPSRAIVTTEGRANDRSALACVRALRSAGRQPVLAIGGDHSLAAASRTVEVRVPLPSDSPDWTARVTSLANEFGAVAIFATSDAALTRLFPKTQRLMDKTSLQTAAEAVGLSTPEGTTFTTEEQLQSGAQSLGFPLVVKPSRKVPGGPGTTVVRNARDLEEIGFQSGLIQAFERDRMSAIAGVSWAGSIVVAIQQRYIRKFPAEAGTASFAVTEQPDQERLDRLERLLVDHRGIFQAQFVGTKLIDVNLRPYGSMPLAIRAGANLPDIACRLAEGRPLPPNLAPAIGVSYRWLDGDIRSVAWSVRKRELSWLGASRALRPVAGTTHSIASLRDPAPLIRRLLHVVGAIG